MSIERQKEAIEIIKASDVKKGNMCFIDNDIFEVMSTEHNQPGKGAAYIHLVMKHITIGQQKLAKFNSAGKVEMAVIKEVPCKFFYFADMSANANIVLLNLETNEEIEVQRNLVHPKLHSFLDSCNDDPLIVLMFGEQPIKIEVPKKVKARVEECDPTFKGETAKSSYKKAVLDNGAVVQVPTYTNAGDMIYVTLDILTGDVSYNERAAS